jgi:guanylate kinase
MLVVSGPSGAGKSTICRRLLEDPRVEFSVSATTRTPRRGEADGRDYIFLDKERFRAHIERGEFIEWAEVHGNLYGTLRAPMEDALARGKVYLVEIDVQGGTQLKALELPGVYVFIAPPNLKELRRRLEGRGTDAPEVVERRLRKANEEMMAQDHYDHVLVNDDLEATVERVRKLVGLS